MTQIRVDSVIRIKDVPEEQLAIIKKDLTMSNPEYHKKKNMGIPVWSIPKQIKLYEENSNEYVLPRGYLARLWNVCRLMPPLKNYTDNRRRIYGPKFQNKTSLRDYQIPAIQQAKNWEQGIIKMPCGSGKTETALAIVAELQQPTLWITHTVDLLKQSMDRAIKNLGLEGGEIGVIQGKNFSIGTHMTFATVQTLSKRDLSEIKDKFGCIVIDECHLVFKDYKNTRMFQSVISQFPAHYRFGVTASDYRSDGLINTMYHVIGPTLYEVTDNQLLASGHIVIPRVEFYETDFSYTPQEDEMLNVKKMLEKMCQDGRRNSILLNILTHDIKQNDCCLVLGDSLKHLEQLSNIVNQPSKKAAYINGTTPKKAREKALEGMRSGEYTYLFATYQLAKLGLDIPRLNKLVFATPKKDKTSIQQSVGRIMRPFPGKEKPIVYDLYDVSIPQLRYWARDRCKVYQSLSCEILDGPAIKNKKVI
mgnify:CR=1 FL=1